MDLYKHTKCPSWFVPFIASILSFLPIMMALQILTGTWEWPYANTVPLSKQLWGIVAVGALALFWNLMTLFVWRSKAHVYWEKDTE